MNVSRPLRVVLALGLTAAIALVAMFSGIVLPIEPGGPVPGSFVTHSIMLGISLVLMWVLSRGRLALFGLTRGSYRLRPTILLWALPTAAFSVLAALAQTEGRPPSAVGDLGRLQTVIFVWIYAGISEEVLTRGLLQTLLAGMPDTDAEKRGFSMPVVLSALFFGAMHLVLIRRMGPAAVAPIVMATFLGFVAARYRQSTGSLIPAVIVHALFNVGGMLPMWIIASFRS
jgi:membrane protease YdiL (CAAX protease family)